MEWLWPVTEATGPLPTSIDFPLIPAESKIEFLAHGFADTQARYETGQDMVREDLVNPLIDNPFGVQFGLTVGDVVFDNLELYDRHKSMMSLMGIPQWYLPGNHDMNFESPNAQFANETYKKHLGQRIIPLITAMYILWPSITWSMPVPVMNSVEVSIGAT